MFWNLFNIMVPGSKSKFKYENEVFSVYNFTCPCCGAGSDKLKIINFDNCCHDTNLKLDRDGKVVVFNASAGSSVSCRVCDEHFYVNYYLDDLEENDPVYLRRLFQKKPK